MKELKKFRYFVAALVTTVFLVSFSPLTLAEDASGAATSADAAATVDAQATTDESGDTAVEEDSAGTFKVAENQSPIPRVRKTFQNIFALPQEADVQKSAFFTMFQWGDVDGKATDTSEINWSVEISIEQGKAQVMGDPLLFDGIDKMDDQTASNTITATTQTTNHWDGLIVKFVPESRENNKVHIKIGEFVKDYTLEELYATHGIYDLTNGRQVAVRSFHRGSTLGSEKREAQFNDKLAVIKRLVKIHEKIKKLLDDGKISEEIVNSLFSVLKRLENNEYSSTEAAKWVKRLGNVANKLDDSKSGEEEDVMLDEVATVNAEFDEDCRASAKDDFKEGFVPFEDTPQCDWYTDFVRRLRSANVVRGMQGTNNFAPGNSISRAELLAIALSSAGVNVDASAEADLAASDTFKDTKGHWAEKGIRYAVKQGLVKGFEDGFRPNHPITRAEALAMLYKVFKLKASESCTVTFKDVDAHWAKCIIEDAKLTGVVNGYEDGTFKPNDPITRAAMAKIISNLVDYIKSLPDHEEI